MSNETTQTPSKKLPLILAAVATAVVIGYLGLCAVAQGSDNILANISINGVEVVGMSKSEAVDAVSKQMNQQLGQSAVTLSSTSWNGKLEGDIASAEIESAVEAAYSMGRESFFTAGFNYLTGKTAGDDSLSVSLSFNDNGLNQFHSLLDEADASMNGAVVQSSWQIDLDKEKLVVTKGVSGAAVDRVAAEEATLVALNESSIGTVTLSTDSTAPNSVDFTAVRQEILTTPQNAELNPDTMEVGDHVLGIDIDPTTANSLYQAATEGETFEISLIITQPDQTKEFLQSTLFADVLATGSTRVTGTAGRQSNVINAAGKMDRILLPGEIYSFIEQCAPWSVSNGYGYASAYVGGATVDELAGGVCQNSSTLYYAVLHTELEVVERTKHRYTVDYLPQAMDATVYSNTLDFKFKNSSDYPIKVVVQVNSRDGSNYVDVTIYGTKTDDITIKPVSTVFNYTGGGVEYVANSSIPAGSTSQVQSAYTGCTATLMRYHYDGQGNLIKEETLYTETYVSRPAIIHYNPADGVPSAGITPEEGEENPEASETPEGEVTTPETDATAPEPVTPAPEVTAPTESVIPGLS